MVPAQPKLFCQDCKTPLNLDGSLQHLNPAAFKILIDSTGSSLLPAPTVNQQIRPAYSADRREEYDRVSKDARSPSIKRTVASHGKLSSAPNKQSSTNPDMSFIMLNKSQVVVPDSQHTPSKRGKSKKKADDTAEDDDSYANQMETVTRLNEILSARSDIDHPICVECTERLIDQMQKRLTNSTRERDAYVDFLRQANADIPTDDELHQARSRLRKLEQREKSAFEELEKLEKEKSAMEAEILELDTQAHELDVKEEEFWVERNAYSEKLTRFQSDRDKLTNQFEHDSKQLERLRRANVYNDTFAIGHDGYFGTINGLRLGRLPDRPVEWSEINAAWGHTALLLATVADKLNFTFKGYELVPMGSTSRVLRYKNTSASSSDPAHAPKPKYDTYKLYSSGEFTLIVGSLFHRDFDNAMIGFLECLRQLIEYAKNTPIQLPDGSIVECPPIGFKIEKDKIGDGSIRLGGLGNQEESWTKACKLTLICCKFLLAHASNVNESRRRG
ncbi:APG6-domain-containing protein [Tothia fuscella]|uniref:APG6-domain-containing protein n=1 Tax=Tothia fuscella TaxID=1048955 RepID=A0A9P4U0K6_9PEZI|nr:APG6-domain-containing protein [Tothia fuscella]